jgi:hypothetical protein
MWPGSSQGTTVRKAPPPNGRALHRTCALVCTAARIDESCGGHTRRFFTSILVKKVYDSSVLIWGNDMGFTRMESHMTVETVKVCTSVGYPLFTFLLPNAPLCAILICIGNFSGSPARPTSCLSSEVDECPGAVSMCSAGTRNHSYMNFTAVIVLTLKELLWRALTGSGGSMELAPSPSRAAWGGITLCARRRPGAGVGTGMAIDVCRAGLPSVMSGKRPT